ncbi:MAG: N-acetylmuramoyl-L-alanine amidase [Verrucomicrobiota bacterium]
MKRWMVLHCVLPMGMALVGGGVLVLAGVACSSVATSGASPSREAMAKYAPALNLRTELMIPKGQFGRKYHRPMKPTYITVHSTQSYSPNANARTHANALKNGYLKATHNLLGYLTWHYSVDEAFVYQSLPTNERGEHADYEGPGNKKSIGIEMCENRGNSRQATVDRTAKLVAVLMVEHGIPLNHVVPHYHWERIRPKTGKNLGHKSCPHFLMDNGKPGAKWQGFLAQVDREYRKVRAGGRL